MISLVVVTWNSANALPGLIESIPEGLGELPYELIVVDNDSADDTVEVARRLAPECVVVQTGRNAGYAAGINAGLAVAQPHRATMVLNPDIRLAPGSVETLFAQLGGRTGITVPMIRHDDGSLAHSLRREPTVARAFGEALLGQKAGRYKAFGETVVDEATYRRTGPADWATGAAMLISAECEEACGPWDESFFLYSEETDYALRARDHGFRTKYVPSAAVTHLGGESRVSPALWSLLTVNKVKLYRKRHSAPRTALFWSAVMLREASRAALGHKRSRSATAALLGRRRPMDN
jgi:N-acetylglucosaminyl-diphospho-decaprenol L-rhamnosyltransferase